MKTPCFALVVMLGLCGCGSPKPDNSFEAAVRRVSEQPCQRGGPLYIDISSSDAKQWRVKSVNHPGEEVSLDAINWGVTNGEVYEGLAHARNYAGKDTLEWATAAVTGIRACTSSMIRQQDLELLAGRN